MAISTNPTATVSRAIDNVTIQGIGQSSYITNDGATAIFSAGSQSGWQFRDFRTELENILNEQLPGLEKALQDSGAPWVKGQPIPE